MIVNTIKRDNKVDNIYYNIELSFPETNNGLVSFEAIRTQDILDKPSDYQLTIERFNIPTDNIPLFFFKQNFYEVGLRINGIFYKKFVSYTQPFEEYDLPPNPIWNITDMSDAINEAFDDAFTDLKNAHTITSTIAPRMQWIYNEKKTKLYVQKSYVNTDNIDIFINRQLFALFSGYQNFGPDNTLPLQYQILVKDRVENSVTLNSIDYFIVEEEFSTLFNWNVLTSIQFETSSIPVSPELLGTRRNLIRNVITDFQPISGGDTNSSVQYFPQGPQRYYDLISDYPLKRIDIKVLWADKEGNTYPIFISENGHFSLKIKFRRRDATI